MSITRGCWGLPLTFPHRPPNPQATSSCSPGHSGLGTGLSVWIVASRQGRSTSPCILGSGPAKARLNKHGEGPYHMAAIGLAWPLPSSSDATMSLTEDINITALTGKWASSAKRLAEVTQGTPRAAQDIPGLSRTAQDTLRQSRTPQDTPAQPRMPPGNPRTAHDTPRTAQDTPGHSSTAQDAPRKP